MKRRFSSLLMAVSLALVVSAAGVSSPVEAASKQADSLKSSTAKSAALACPNAQVVYTAEQLRIVGRDSDDTAVKDLLAAYSDLVQASNRHSLADILKHYSPQFLSGDNLTLDNIKGMIEETWQAYPDICYESTPIELRFNGDWATLETSDRSSATAQADPAVMNVNGTMKSESRSMLFFRRMGNTWEINSDLTLWEQAQIRYGIADSVKIVLSSPEQVKAGESYSAHVLADLPDGTFTIASVDNQALTYPHEKPDDHFRTMAGEFQSLQRVLKANTQNRNELVTATIGLTNVYQKTQDRPSLALNGIVTIVKRVNVVPISADDVMKAMARKGQVQTSASGEVDLLHNAPAPEAEPTAPASEEGNE